MTRRIIAAILATLALATAALAQPITLPPNSVFGRLGISSGPGQAIPIFPNLQSLVAGNEADVADANYSFPTSDATGLVRVLAYTSLTAARTATLNSAASYAAGTRIFILDRSGSASGTNTISLAPNGSDKINGSNSTTVAINFGRGVAMIESDGTGQWVLTSSLPPITAPTANQIPVFPGSGGNAVPTSAPSWFDNAYCNTIGYVIVRMSGAWTCNNSIPANVDWFANVHGDGGTDDTAGIQAVLNAVNGIVKFSSKHYCIKSGGGLTTTMANQQLIGSRGTNLDSCGADLTVLTINADSIIVRNMSINSTAGLSVSTNHNVLNFGTACVRCRAEHLDLAGGYYNVLINAPYTGIYDIRTGNAHGPAVVKVLSASSSSPGVFMDFSQIDQAWPVSTPSGLASISAWASNHSYTTTGTVVSTGGYYIQLSSGSCTSNNGAAPTLLDYGNSITDGTCTWKLAAPTTFYGLDIDTGSVNVFVTRSDFTGPYTAGVHLENSASGTAPIEVILGYGDTFSGNITASIQADAGSMLQIDKVQIQNGVLASAIGVWLKSTFTGNYTIDSAIMLGLGSSSDGILDQASGSNGGTIANSLIYNGGSAGISIGANINNRSIIGNHAGSSSLGTNGDCVFVLPGTGDYLTILGNECNGASSAGVVVTSVTGTHNWIVNGGSATPSVSFNLMFPAITRAGDVPYWNGSIWTTLAGNNSGTACLVENSSGAPSFTTCPTGTIVAGTTATSGITSGNFMSSTSNLVQDSGKAVPSGAVVGTTDTQTLTNKTFDTASNTFKLNGTTAGTAAQMRTATEQGMTLLSVNTLSNQATFTDTSDFSASYDDYMIVIDNMVPVTNAVTAQLQVHSGGTYQNSSYLTAGSNTTFIELGGGTVGNNAGIGASGVIYIHNVNSTSVNKIVEGRVASYSGSAAQIGNVGGFWNGGQGAVDGFQLLFSSGNLSTGTIKVYGLRNAL